MTASTRGPCPPDALGPAGQTPILKLNPVWEVFSDGC